MSCARPLAQSDQTIAKVYKYQLTVKSMFGSQSFSLEAFFHSLWASWYMILEQTQLFEPEPAMSAPFHHKDSAKDAASSGEVPNRRRRVRW